MTQRRHSTFTPRKFGHRSLLVQGLGWIGSLGLLSGGMVLAQTAPEGADTVSVPSAQDLLMPSEPQQAAPSPAASSPAPIIVVPQPSAPEVQPSEPVRSPATTIPTQPTADAPIVVPGYGSDDPVSTNPVDQSGQYIDSTDYSVGATQSDRPSIVFSERSTGCQAVVSSGGSVPASICTPRQAETASSGGGSVNIGPLRFSPSGVSFNGGSTSSIREYITRTIRPAALPGNGNVSLMFPLSIPATVTSVFGWRIHPISGQTRFHQGTDLGAPMGTPIVAAFSGKVTTANYLGGYGLTVILAHGDHTVETLYAHMSELFVQPGDTVEQGEVIGRVGSTGNSTGPHLHFEFRQRTAQGWLAMDAGDLLQNAVSQLVNGFRTAQLPPASESTLAHVTKSIKELGLAGRAADVYLAVLEQQTADRVQ